MLTGKDIHAGWAYAENESTARRGFQPHERGKWESLPEVSKEKYELMAEFLNDKINPDGLDEQGQEAWTEFQKGLEFILDGQEPY